MYSTWYAAPAGFMKVRLGPGPPDAVHAGAVQDSMYVGMAGFRLARGEPLSLRPDTHLSVLNNSYEYDRMYL